MIGITRAIKGLVKQAVSFKDDPAFVDSIQETLSSSTKANTFRSHIDERNVAPVDSIDEFKERVEALDPARLKSEILQKILRKFMWISRL